MRILVSPLKFNYLLLFLVLLSLLNCEIPVVTSQPEQMPYRSDHFTLYYDSLFLTPSRIEKIALVKEQQLKNINRYLSCAYDGVIEVHLANAGSGDRSYLWEWIYAPVDYVERESGYEIACVIVSHQWGYPRVQILFNCIVAAACADKEVSAFDSYRSSFRRQKSEIVVQQVTAGIDSLRVLFENYELTSRVPNGLDGAFVHFLKVNYGIHTIKVWYQSSLVSRSETNMVDTFQEIFGRSLDEVMGMFRRALITGRIHME